MNIGLILAAGKGLRLEGTSVPKQFLIVNDTPIFMFSTLTFQRSHLIDKIIIVTDERHGKEVEAYCKKFKITKLMSIVFGGDTRQESVFNGLNYLYKRVSNDDIVLIHDSARPLVTENIIADNVLTANRLGNAITCIEEKNSLIRVGKNLEVKGYLNREEIYEVQTPQSFVFKDIYKAHNKALECNIKNAKDDACLVKELGINLNIVDGSTLNFKITKDDDLGMFEMLVIEK